MMPLVDEIERVMRNVNPFGYTDPQYSDYYYEANNMIKLLPNFKGDKLDLCMDSFQLYYDGSPVWKQLEAEISQLFDQIKSHKRTKIIRPELMALAMSPQRVVSMINRYGPHAPAKTFT